MEKIEMAQQLKNMDKVIRMINDEGNGIAETWRALFVSDGDTVTDIAHYDNIEEMYIRAGVFFASSVSRLIVNGEFNASGFTKEIFNAGALDK